MNQTDNPDTEGEQGFVDPADRDRRCVRCGRVGHRSNGCTWPVTLPDADTRVTAVGLPVDERKEKVQ